MNYFTINGVKSTDVGIICKKQPDIVLAAPRMTYQTIPGRDGSLVIAEEGPDGEPIYDDVTLTCECYMRDLSRISEAAAFLAGAGDISFPVRPGGHYRGRVTNQITLEQIMRGRTQRQFEVMFRMEPFWYRDGVLDTTICSATDIRNAEDVSSEPILNINCTADAVLYIGDTVVNIRNTGGYFILDCELKMAYRENKLMNSYISIEGPWPRLKPGYTHISWTGGISAIALTPNWRRR